MRIVVVTSLAAAAEPRGPRHAVAAGEAFPDAEVIFVDLQPHGVEAADPPALRAAPSVRRLTLRYPTRKGRPLALAWRRARVAAARPLLRLTGAVTEPLFGPATIGLGRALKRLKPDMVIAHNIETLLPAARAAAGGRLVFDCMEYYSDMGDSQTPEAARGARILERRWLPRCDLVMASSAALGRVLAGDYAIPQPLALYNTPPIGEAPARSPEPGLKLYWRNAVVGFGQRGLDDILIALTLLPDDVTLTVQGRPAADGGARLAARIAELGLAGRVSVLGPYPPGEAVSQAGAHQVGLCLERRGPANHEYTVSNKLFDYLMAGLAVVVADLPSLRDVVERSGGGLLFEPGSPADLAEKIQRLRDAPAQLVEFSGKARRFALTEGNVTVDMDRFKVALRGLRGVDGGNRQ